MKNFEEYLHEQDASPLTISGYIGDVEHFAKWFKQTNGDELTPARLTPTDLREYKSWLTTRKSKPASTNRKLAAIRAWARWAMDVGQIDALPKFPKSVERVALSPKYLDRREQAALLRETERGLSSAQRPAAKQQAIRDRAILAVLLNTGLRVEELCSAKLADIELGERKGKIIVRQGKGAKHREIPLNSEVRNVLRDWLKVRPDGGSLLLTGKRGEGLSASGVHRRLELIGQRAGIEVHAHTLRHSFAKNLINAGVSLEKVAALLGHSDLNTTRIYITPGERDLEKAVELLV